MTSENPNTNKSNLEDENNNEQALPLEIETSGGQEGLEDRIETKILEQEMQDSYLKYAMSVIVSRALPDVRDGLKPVHRRIVYVMNKMGLTPGSKYRKSAQIVGEVMGKYHPHGDVAIYDSLVRMAQDFSLRYPLVDGQGNFGSLDGDSAAAMRYTESKMQKTATYLVSDIDKDTVDFVDNYDGSNKEPKVLPSRLPNLIINGVSGIAVGMATNIPPHNLGEVCEALLHLQKNPEATIEELMEFIKGPDLPTGGIIYGTRDILNGYQTGRGKCALRSKAILEEDRIIVTEIPYQVNKSTLIEKIAELAKEKKVEGTKDLRDESNKEGVRIVIECRRDAAPEIILNQLYKDTELQTNINFNFVALVNDGRQPKLLNIKEILVEFLVHRDNVVTRRTQFELREAEAELHILDGLKIALDFIDEVIKLIRSSYDKAEAAQKLKDRFEFSDLQVEAILQMRLQTLTNLDKAKIEEKRQALISLITKLKEILENPEVKNKLIADEISEVGDKLSSKRKTEIVAMPIGDYNKEDYIADEEVLVQLTQQQYLKVLPTDTFRQQGRGGRGVSSFNAKDEDWVKASQVANMHDHVYAFTNTGRVFKTRVFELPSGSRVGRGQNLINYFELKEGEKITNLLTLTKEQEEAGEGSLVFATEKGLVKKTYLKDFENTRKTGIIAITLKEKDNLVDVRYSSSPQENIVLSGSNGKTVIFDCYSLSATGRTSMGVKGMRIKDKEKVISLQISNFNFEEGGED
jgi:DNA gyrase subunit A